MHHAVRAARPNGPGTMDDTETSSSEPPSPDGDPPGRERTPRFDLLDPDRILTDDLRARLRGHVLAALPLLGARGEARARVVNDADMTDAHLRYAGVHGTTDVLTFDLSDNGTLDADLLICADVARRRADDLGHPIEHELTLYIIHGLLHCLGHDDKSRDDARRMHAEEDRILTAIGVGPVFAARGEGRT
ncbi:MAG: rRNA maturation RNase YbeY [Phycisphaerales bacterium]|nr:rRNA maturation RNase YbeY [Phycisphaerales bacterium]